MQPMVIHADRLFTPFDEITDAVVVVRGSKIAALGKKGQVETPRGVRATEFGGKIIVPGFVDVHIHGAGGRDVMDGTADALDTVARTVATHGTTSLVATTVTASEKETCLSVAGIADYILEGRQQSPRDLSAEILGIHFEGPFISPARRGVHPTKWIAAPSIEALGELLKKARGTAQIITLAPELPEALELIASARQAGLVISLGHTDATYDEASAAIEAGATHAAHVYNAMRPFSHRETGVLGAVLTSPKVSAELIADRIHVDDAAMRMLVAMKTSERVILVSDGMSATGMPDGKYQLGLFEVKVAKGVARNAEGKLAGSTLTLDRALRNMVALGVPFVDALRMVTANPARQIGLEARKGILAVGADADLVLLNNQLEVSGVMTRGAGLSLSN
jgi:N-acetylglucosamine-6-phosphate deacetylase